MRNGPVGIELGLYLEQFADSRQHEIPLGRDIVVRGISTDIGVFDAA